MIEFDLTYRPAGPTVAAFHRSDAFVRGLRGPIGGGKSTACMAEIVRRSLAQPPGIKTKLRRSRWAVVRNTLPQLKTTTIKTWHQWVPQQLGRWTMGPPPTHHLRLSDLDCEIIFLALDRPDDVRKLLSLELTGAWINEAREVPRAILDGLTGRVGRYPERADGGPAWSGIIMDTNSPDTDHWWYRMAEEQVPEGYAFFAQPAGDGPDAENAANLPPDYYRRAAQGKEEGWVTVYVRGEYGFVRDGKPVYPEYRDPLHAAAQPLAAWPGLPLTVGVDFGLTPAAAISQRGPRGHWRVLGELVAEDMGAQRFGALLATELARRWPGLPAHVWADPAGRQRAQTDERSAMDILAAQLACPVSAAPSNEFTLRREAVAATLSRLIDGEPGLALDPSCRMLRKGFAGHYRYRRLATSGERWRDAPDKNEFSHVHDALQYALLGGGEGDVVRGRKRLERGASRALTDYDIHGFE